MMTSQENELYILGCKVVVITVQWFVCLSVTMVTSQGNGLCVRSAPAECLTVQWFVYLSVTMVTSPVSRLYIRSSPPGFLQGHHLATGEVNYWPEVSGRR